MTVFQYYIYTNAYVLFFWFFYRIFIKNQQSFQSIRLYIIAILFSSLFLPFLQNCFARYLDQVDLISYKINLLNAIYLISEDTVVRPSVYTGVAWSDIVTNVILSGSIIIIIFFLYAHLRIWHLIKKSEMIVTGDVKLALCDDFVVPFIYNEYIIIPKSIPLSERQMIITHELLHKKHGHQFDNYLLQLFQVIFWINPLFYIIKRNLRLVHEYQVDRSIISTDIDVSLYKLTLIKFSVGYQKFAIANGLSYCKIKNRLIMMNNKNMKNRKWKFALLIPILSIAFIILSFTNTKKPQLIGQQIRNIETFLLQDTNIVEIFMIQANEAYANKADQVLIMMNSRSQLLINGERCTINNITDKVYSFYQKGIDKEFGKLNTEILERKTSEMKICIIKDIRTDKNDYKKMLNFVSIGIFKLQEFYSLNLYNKSFASLSNTEKEKVNKIVKPVIYKLIPNKKNNSHY